MNTPNIFYLKSLRHGSASTGKLLFLILLGVYAHQTAYAATIPASSCSSSAVQSAINAASSGDTVLIPGGSATYTATVTIPNTKGITVNGGGCRVTSNATTAFSVNQNSSATTRITNFVFSASNQINGIDVVRFSGSPTSATGRIDHSTFTSSDNSTFIATSGNAAVLIDNNSFTSGSAAEMIHNMGLGAGNAAGWTTDVTPGSANMVFIEDNTFTYPASGNPAYYWGTSAVQSYYGARTVFRHNYLSMAHVDQHGTAGMIGARWWEIYQNTFNVVPNGNVDKYIGIRAGSGVIFNNYKVGSPNQGSGGIVLYEEDSGYPALYQVGRGINQTYSPAYVWGHDAAMGTVRSQSSNVAVGRDFFVSTTMPATMLRQQMTGDTTSTAYVYSPYPHPHPLQGTTQDTSPPTVSITGPANGASVGGTVVPVSATASDNVAVVGVQFRLDGVNLGSELASSPYSFTWNSTTTTNGSHVLTAVARDAAGNTATTSPVSVIVANALLVSISSPAYGATVSGASVAVSATGSGGIAGVQFKLDGANLGAEDITSPYLINWNSTSTNNGQHTLTAVARDSVGNTATATSVTVTVDNNASTEIIDASRRITWSVGVPGGIPSRTTVCATVNADTTGATDATPAIQTAINNCASGQVVLIPAGTYRLNSQISITKGITVRCADPLTTFLRSYANWHAVQFGNFPSSPVSTNVSGSPVKGSTTITVASITSPSLSVGDYIVIDQLNDGVEVVNVDEDSRNGGTRSLREVKKITGVNSLTITFDPPLYHGYSAALDPEVWKLSQGNSMTVRAGLENCFVDRVSPTGFEGYSNIKIVNCVECWVKNVTSKGAQFRHVDVDRSYRNEIRDSYFNDGQHHGTGGFAYGVVAAGSSADNLVENNIFRHLRHAMVIKEGASGNVYAYNYSIESYQGENWLAADLNAHGAHSHNNLFEGNIAAQVYGDFTHGSSSYNTVFRNHVTRDSTPPEQPVITSGRRAVDIERSNAYWNIVGNVLGQSSQSWDAYDPGATRSSTGRYVYNLGYGSGGDTTRDDPAIPTYIYLHGNWDEQTDSVIWNSANSNHTLPSSLYLSGKPAFFGSCAWPAIGSDLSPRVGALPAKARYEGSSVCSGTVDNIPPVVTVIAPANGATVSGTSVTASATASDNIGVLGVQFKLGGVNLGAEDMTSPYSITWDTTTAINGSHVLTAVARDAAGNTTTSTVVTVTVNNAATSGSLLVYLKFDESGGTVAADSSGNGLNGLLVNAPAFVAGQSGNAISLNGSNQSVDLGNPAQLQVTGSMTISAWINSSSFPVDDAAIVSKRTSSNIGYQLDTTVDTGARRIGFKLTNSSGFMMARYGSTTLSANTWYYVTGVYDAAAQTINVYLNGNLNNDTLSGTVTSTQQNSPLNVFVGRRTGTTGFEFAGKIDEVRIYRRALTQSEIQADMNGAGPPSDTVPPTVSITAPTNSSIVPGASVTVSATASDNVGVAGVQFKLDGVNLGAEDTSAPFSVNWNTTQAADGSHTLTAVARDAVGNATTSATINVTVDKIAPTVSVAAPANGATVPSGNVALSASAADNIGVAGVQFKVDGANVGSEITVPPYSVTWNATSPGSHTVAAVARDAAGNQTTSSNVTVTVGYSNDPTPPTVSITSPFNGATVSGTIVVSANASDNVGVVGVQFKANGTNLGAEVTTQPYSVSWNTAGVWNGSVTLTAVARDAAGNAVTSQPVVVTVENSANYAVPSGGVQVIDIIASNSSSLRVGSVTGESSGVTQAPAGLAVIGFRRQLQFNSDGPSPHTDGSINTGIAFRNPGAAQPITVVTSTIQTESIRI